MNTIFFRTLFIVAMLAPPVVAFAQYRMGFRLELNRAANKFDGLVIPATQTDNFTSLSLTPKMKGGGGFGFMGQFPFAKILFIQTEALFDFQNATYTVVENSPTRIDSSFLKESIIWLDVPVSAGVKLFGIKGFVGGSARFAMSHTSEIAKKYPNYTSKNPIPIYTWHYGIGLDLPMFDGGAALAIDLRAETGLDSFANGTTYGGTKYDFGMPFKRYVLAVGVVF